MGTGMQHGPQLYAWVEIVCIDDSVGQGLSSAVNKACMDYVESPASLADNNQMRQVIKSRGQCAQFKRIHPLGPSAAALLPALQVYPIYDGIDHHPLVVAHHREETCLVEQIQGLTAAWTAIDQVTDRKKAVSYGIKIDLGQCHIEHLGLTMKVAHDKIASTCVSWQSLYSNHSFLSSSH